jgi:hypothetical protein
MHVLFFTGMTKILVMGGKNSKSVEVISLTNNLMCFDLPDLPLELLAATGQLFDGNRPIICGGLITDVDSIVPDYSCACYELTSSVGSWKNIEPLVTCREHLASALIEEPTNNFNSNSSNSSNSSKKDLLFAVGGVEWRQWLPKEVDVFNGSTWDISRVAHLPLPVFRHC